MEFAMGDSYDVLIIGAGQAGIPLARSLAKSGRKVALAEHKQLGGSCVNFGCTPPPRLSLLRHEWLIWRAGQGITELGWIEWRWIFRKSCNGPATSLRHRARAWMAPSGSPAIRRSSTPMPALSARTAPISGSLSMGRKFLPGRLCSIRAPVASCRR